MSLPPGTAAYLFTDVVGSTRLWEQHPEQMQGALARHDAIMRTAFGRHGGEVFSIAGDSFGAAFATASAAVTAAVEIQTELAGEDWPDPIEIRPRIGVHVGPSTRRAGNFFGTDVNRAARLMSVAHGGQIVVSEAVRAHVDSVPVVDLGEHLLKDLTRPEHIFEVVTGLFDEPFPPLRTLDRSRVRLPIQPSALLGRDDDASEVAERLGSTRLLTLRGLGGIGKTRLATHVGADVADRFPDGVRFVELARVGDETAVAYAVADALDFRVPSGTTPVAAVVGELGDQHRLVILDNCEHLIDAVRDLVSEMLRSCPNVTVLATSRIALNVAGEVIYGLDPLLHDSIDSSAVALFVERAKAVNSKLDVDAERLETIAHLCARLDGVPLAIELAAARCRSMTPEEVASHLDDRFALLRAREGEIVRHRSLLKTLEWSFEQLDDTARLLFRRMSVFAGPATLTSITEVCDVGDLGRFEIIDALDTLVDNSILLADVSEQTTSFRMLETIREFGVSLVGDEAADLRERHARHVADEVQRCTRELLGAGEAVARRQLGAIWDDLRAAVAYSRTVGDVSLASRLVGQLAGEVLWLQRVEAAGWAAATMELTGFDDLDALDRVGVMVTAASGMLDELAAPRSAELLAEVPRLVPDHLPGPADPALLAATSVHFFIGDLTGGKRLCTDLLGRLLSDDRRSEQILWASGAAMCAYAGDLEGAETWARTALGIDVAGPSPTWIALARWNAARGSRLTGWAMLDELDGVFDQFVEAGNDFGAHAVQRHQVAVRMELAQRADRLTEIVDGLRSAELDDARDATGWMLLAAIELGEAEVYEPAAALLAWQARHRMAPVQPGPQERVDRFRPAMEEALGSGLASVHERGASMTIDQAVRLAIGACEAQVAHRRAVASS